jgi:hypothetical protein
MQDADDFMSPEPIRFMYDSDEDHVRAWLAWAEQTPGGWRARLADKRQTDNDVALAQGARAARSAAGPTRRHPVRHVVAPSPCCGTEVLVDPDASLGRLGLCSTCGTMLSHQGSWWQRRPQSQESE